MLKTLSTKFDIDMHENGLLMMMEKIAKKELNRNEVAKLLRKHSIPQSKD